MLRGLYPYLRLTDPGQPRPSEGVLGAAGGPLGGA